MPDLPSQDLRDQIETLKHNRTTYPGWLIAPEQVREGLLDQIKVAIPHFMRIRPNLSLYQDIELLFELNWRLETALLPIWNELVPAYESVLGAINPFPNDITDLNSATLVLTEATEREADWTAVRRQWLAIGFGLLRFHREERHVDAFENLHARLERVSVLNSDAQARLCYERCLFAFGELDDEAAIRAIGKWPHTTHDVFWSIRRAAVLAEVGRTEEALAVAESALVKLRDGLWDDVEHIPRLSREGWAVWLVLALRSNRRWQSFPVDDSADRAEARSRFNQLKTYGCSPDEINDYFMSRLERPTPQARPHAETKPGFAPGTYSRTMHFGEDIGMKLVPAYQYSRLVEEAGHPPDFGHTTLSKNILKRVAEWLSEHDAVRTQSLMIRLRDDELIGSYLSRHRVAALPLEIVMRLKAIARHGVANGLPNLPLTLRPERDEQNRASDRLVCGLELLARVCVREKEEGLGDFWELGCKLYKEPSIRAGLRFDKPLQHFFGNLIESTEDAQLVQRLPALFRLPIAGDATFPVSMPDHWFDPAIMASKRFETPIWQRPPAVWTNVARTVFEVARTNNNSAKRTAFVRLFRMKDLGALSAVFVRQLAEMFWAPAGDPPALPMETWHVGTPWFALSLPEPNRQIGAVGRVKHHLLSRQLGTVHGGVVQPESYFSLLLYATGSMDSRLPSPPHRWHIQWSGAEINRLFLTIREWWQVSGRKTADEMRNAAWLRARDGTAVRSFMNGLFDVMRTVIIPRLNRRDTAQVMDLISDIESSGMPVGSVLPATLIMRPNSLNRVVSRLRQEFANPSVEYYLSALRGIAYWVEQNRETRRGRARLPSVPPDLLREISMAVALRHPESLRLSLDFAFRVVRRSGKRIDRQFVRNLLTGLDYLLGETAYQLTVTAVSRFQYEQIPELRFLAARLAKSLSDSGHTTNPIIRKWSDAVRTDPLPEIRRVITGANSGG